MPHITSLGVKAIWITPIFDSQGADGGEKLQASGYFAKDYFSIDPNFGTESDLHELVDKAHYMGIYVFQFTDYDKYESTAFSEPHKRQQRDEQFPKDLQSAFDEGVKVAYEIQDETVMGEPLDHVVYF